jgi:hypothetical protein
MFGKAASKAEADGSTKAVAQDFTGMAMVFDLVVPPLAVTKNVTLKVPALVVLTCAFLQSSESAPGELQSLYVIAESELDRRYDSIPQPDSLVVQTGNV